MEEKRRSPREDVFTTIMISPNGHENRATVYNVSESGARVGLPADFKRSVGAPVRLFFTVDEDVKVMRSTSPVRTCSTSAGSGSGRTVRYTASTSTS